MAVEKGFRMTSVITIILTAIIMKNTKNNNYSKNMKLNFCKIKTKITPVIYGIIIMTSSCLVLLH